MSLFFSDPSDDKLIPADVILIGPAHGQIGLQNYKYYPEEEIRTMTSWNWNIVWIWKE